MLLRLCKLLPIVSLFLIFPLFANAQLVEPQGIAFDATSGDVLVADQGSADILKINLTTDTIVTTYTGDGFLQAPVGIALGPDGNIYVTDENFQGVVEINPSDDSVIKTYTGSGFLQFPQNITLDKFGNIFVTDSSLDEVVEINPSDDSVTHTYTGTGTLANPQGIALDSAGNIYVADRGNAGIVEINPSDDSVIQIYTGDNFLTTPYDVTLDSSGNIFVADPGNADIVEINPSDDSVTHTYTGTGALASPEAIALDTSGNIFVADPGESNAVGINPTDDSVFFAYPDVTPPVITLLGDADMTIDRGDTFIDPGATAEDNVDGDITSNIIVGGDIVDTSTLGDYIITYDVFDNAGNAANEVTRTVHVVSTDVTPPVITLLGDADMTLDVGDTFTDPGATAEDNVDGDISGNISVGGDTVDTSTPGTYVITYDVSDSSGNPAVEVTRTVHVIGPPVITLNGDSDIDIEQDTTFTDPGATAEDGVDGNITSSIVETGSVNTSIVGDYTLTYNVSDSAHLSAIPVTLTVHVTADVTSPVITLNGDSDIDIEQDTTFTDPGATASDDADGNITSSIVVTGSVNTSIVGDYTLTYNVSDRAGNPATPVTRTVHVTADVTPPTITLNGDTEDPNINIGDIWTDPGETAIDDADGDISSSIVVTGSVDNNVAGDYTLTYNVSDRAGNPATPVTRTIHVLSPGTFIPVGLSPYTSILVGTKLYVNNSYNDTTSVIDTNTNNVIATIPGGSGYRSVLVGTKLYSSADSVFVIDTNTNSIIDTISASPFGSLVYDTNTIGTKLYFNIGGIPSTVAVVDSGTDSILTSIPVGNIGDFGTIFGTTLYVTNEQDNTVSAIDTDTDSVIATIPVGAFPTYSAIVGKKLYVGNEDDGTISVIDTATNEVIDTITMGGNPGYLVSVGTKLYAEDRFGGIVVIDTNTDSVLYTITVGENPIYSIVVGKKLYVINNGDGTDDGTVSVIDTDTDTVIADITVGVSSQYATLAGTRLYVSNLVNGTDDGSVSVIDTLTDTLLNVAVPVLTSFTSSSADGDYSSGQTVDVTANFGRALGAGSTMTVTLNTGATVVLNSVLGNTLSGSYVVGAEDASPDLSVSSIVSASVSDTSSHTGTSYAVPPSPELTGFANGNVGDTSNIVIGQNYCSIPVGTNPYQLATVGSITYVANEGSNTVSIVNTSTNNVIKTISVGDQPYGVAYDSTSKEVYVTNIDSNTVSVIDANPTSNTYNTVTHTIAVGVQPFYLATIGSNVYVTNNLSNTVSVIATGSHTVTNTISVGDAPLGIKALGTHLYVANSNDGSNYSGSNTGSISVIDSTDNTVTDTIVVGSGPRGVAVSGTEVYVTNFNDNTVSVIDGTDDTVTNTIAVGLGPRGILALGTNIYVENFDDGTISVIDTGTHTVTATIKSGNAPAGMAAVGTLIYVSRFTDSVVSILDTTDNTLLPAGSNCPTVTPPPSNNSGGNTAVSFHPGGSSGGGGETSYTLPAISSASNVPLFSTVTTSITIPTFSRSLSIGATGADVEALQVFLNSHGFPIATSGAGSAGNETTTFGPLTSKALMAFQSAYNIPLTGTLGPLTTAAINIISQNSLPTTPAENTLPPTSSFSRDLTTGSTGADVKALQVFLNSPGFLVASSGAGSVGNETTTFGPLTVKALAAFQKANNITPAVGYFGPKTMAAIQNILK